MGSDHHAGQESIEIVGAELYGYDNADRLQKWSRLGLGDTVLYEYDKVGNRTLSARIDGQDMRTYQYGAPTSGPNRLQWSLQQQGVGISRTEYKTEYGYNLNGSIVERKVTDLMAPPFPTLVSEDHFGYSYRELNWKYLNGNPWENNHWDWRYRYNAQGEREQKRLYHGPLADSIVGQPYPWVQYLLGGSKEQLAVWHGQQMTSPFCDTAWRRNVFLYPTEYLSYGAGKHSNVVTRPDGAKEYRFFDHLGSSRAVLGSNGFTYSDYAPFGGLLAGGTESRKGFIGKEKDRESDLRNHGVRLFDDEAGRFLSIDPLWEKYKLLTPYQYGANNPLMISDPDGMKLWLHKDDVKNPSPAFRKWYKEFKKAIKYLNSGKASGVLARLHKSKDVTYIRPTFSETRYEADKKTIYWSAEYGLRLSNGYTQTPALGLIHEGGHRALELEKTPEQMKELLEKSDNKFENKEEQQVYEKYENPAAVKLGEPLAPDHGGQIEETDGSDQRNPDMPVVTTVPLETLND